MISKICTFVKMTRVEKRNKVWYNKNISKGKGSKNAEFMKPFLTSPRLISKLI